MPIGLPIKILYVTQWFEPEPVFKGIDFAKGLSDAGFVVDVLTGFPNYPHGKLYDGYKLRPLARDTMKGLRVIRAFLYPSHSQSSIGRALNYLSFCVSVVLHGLFRARYDAIYVYHPPITTGLGVAVSGMLRRTPFILDVQDLWPESVTASGMAGGRVVQLLNRVCGFVYRRATKIVAQSHGMRQRLLDRGVPDAKMETILNWADEAALDTTIAVDLAPYDFDGRFTFVYAGNIGAMQALESVVEAAKQAHAINPVIRVLLIGGGVRRDAVEQAAAGHPAIAMMPPVSREQIGVILRRSEVQLVHLADDPLFQITIPSKVQFYMAVGRPILAAVPGEAARLVEGAGAGRSVASENPPAIAAAMLAMASQPAEALTAMGAAGQRYYREHLAFEQAIQRTSKLLREVAGH